MDLFQRMVVDAVSRVIGPLGEVLSRQICQEIGLTLDGLKPRHMDDFANGFVRASKGLLDDRRALSAAAILRRFKDSRIAETDIA